MKKLFVLFAVALIIGTASMSIAGDAGSVEDKGVREKISQGLGNVNVEGFQINNALNMYEVLIDGRLYYVTKDFRYVFSGTAFDVVNKVNVTEETLEKMRKVDFSKLPLENAVKVGSGKARIAIFSDPECQYCRKLHEEIKKVLADATVYVYLFPLPAHQKARVKSEAIWCADNKGSELDKVYSGLDATNSSTQCKTPIDDNLKLGKTLHVNSTPTIIFESGRMVSGYITAEKIKELLKGVQ